MSPTANSTITHTTTVDPGMLIQLLTLLITVPPALIGIYQLAICLRSRFHHNNNNVDVEPSVGLESIPSSNTNIQSTAEASANVPGACAHQLEPITTNTPDPNATNNHHQPHPTMTITLDTTHNQPEGPSDTDSTVAEPSLTLPTAPPEPRRAVVVAGHAPPQPRPASTLTDCVASEPLSFV